MQDVDLRQLRAFVAVVDAGTFTDAAIDLDVSQATVSRNVAGLEAVLGVRLLHRSAREVALTAEGIRVLPHARAVLAQVAALGSAAVEVAGEYRVGFVWGALGRHTRAVQQRWADENDGSELVFVQSLDPSAGLDEGRAHVAVVRWRLDERRYETALLGVERRYAALPASDPLAAHDQLSVTELAGRTVALDRETGTTTPDLFPADAPMGPVRSVRGVEAWLTLIGAGQAIGITPEATVDRHRSDDVVYRPLTDAPPQPVWAAWLRDVWHPGTDHFVRLCREHFAG